MTQWNTDLPTQLVVGWTRVDAVTDEQIDALLRNCMPQLYSVYSAPEDNIPDWRNFVREWLANL